MNPLRLHAVGRRLGVGRAADRAQRRHPRLLPRAVHQKVEHALHGFKSHRHFVPAFAVVVGIAVIFVTGLHIVEAAVWAAAYRFIGAIADNKSAMLYSLGALTTYGHDNIHLEAKWQMMGALEALNGMLLFGLTTAFLFAMIQRVWPTARR